MSQILLFPVSSEKLRVGARISNLLKFTQLANREAMVQTNSQFQSQDSWPPGTRGLARKVAVSNQVLNVY